MNAMALCNNKFEDRNEYMAKIYTDIAINAFNSGYIDIAKKCLLYAKDQYNEIEMRLHRFLDLLESLDERFLKRNSIEAPLTEIAQLYAQVSLGNNSNSFFHVKPETERILLKSERLRLIEESKDLLKLIENKEVEDAPYKNVGKIELDPEKFLTLTLANCDDLDTLKELFIKSKILFPDYDFGPFKEILEEKQKERKKNTTYSFNSNSLNVNNLEEAENLLKTARKYFYERNLDRAKKLVEKAERMHKTRSGEELLNQVMREIREQANDTGENQHNPAENQHNPDENQYEADDSRNHISNLNKPETDLSIQLKRQELISEIQRIKEAKDDYEILKVSRHSSDEEQIKELKKTFRYLTKELHPDQIRAFNNRNPEASIDTNDANEAYMSATSAKTRLDKKLKKNMKK